MSEVEFSIEMYLGTNLISITPYIMDSTKKIKLKKQMQELLEKGFIRSSHSRWGASVLLLKKMGFIDCVWIIDNLIELL